MDTHKTRLDTSAFAAIVPGKPYSQHLDTEPDTSTEAAVIVAAEQLLSQRFGGTQKIVEYKNLGGSGIAIVLRAKLAPSPFIQQRSVVVKYLPQTGLAYDKSAMLREIIAYQFTTSLSEDVRPGPFLIAYDVAEKLLIISDSGDGDTFAELLDTQDEQLRISILRNLGEAIGKMHAGTADKEADYTVLLKRMMHKYPELQEMYQFREKMVVGSISVGLELLARAGIHIPAVVAEFAQDAARRLLHGQHRAFTPFDLSPDNVIVSTTTHFLDYEWAGFRDAAFDVAGVVAGFPQFLFSQPISDDEVDVFISAWRNEVQDMWPNVKNSTRLSARIVTALIGWGFSSLALMHLGALPETFEELLNGDLALDQLKPETVVEYLVPVSEKILQAHASEQSEEIAMIRRDLWETFEALQRYAERGTDPRFPVVAGFAEQVCHLLRK